MWITKVTVSISSASTQLLFFRRKSPSNVGSRGRHNPVLRSSAIATLVISQSLLKAKAPSTSTYLMLAGLAQDVLASAFGAGRASH
ncbi:hypothetical protein D0469_07960 [Peribacillus saganii]|uniref:Uncharacterized protein n=1 Tax=Peribacillus saganii TaxID=2303992 RepID=A0A372LQ75_9BACI|nr:hypothetical protein D0469_07960 [Peribacillus saganii]